MDACACRCVRDACMHLRAHACVCLQSRGVGLGLLNPHTLCFVNSVVQALAYTPGFADDCLEERHRLSCCTRQRAAARRKEAAAAAAAGAAGTKGGPVEVPSTFCAFCKLEQQVLSIHRKEAGGGQRAGPRGPTGGAPRGWIHNSFAAYIKPFIWKAFRPGRQEDAHEFFRYLIDALMKAPATPAAAALQQQQQQQQGRKEMKPEVALTSYFGRLFGCWLRSSVVCSQCNKASVRFEGAVDISLDIGGPSGAPSRPSGAAHQNAYSIEKALSRFIAKETLSGSNAYMWAPNTFHLFCFVLSVCLMGFALKGLFAAFFIVFVFLLRFVWRVVLGFVFRVCLLRFV